MDWTDRHCRYFLRGFSRHTLLYTEMITAAALVRGGRRDLLEHHPEEQPLALQLGGNDPAMLAQAARMGAEAGFVEINLNCGCPSDRVASGSFGACLMQTPGRVADCVAAMKAVTDLPVTVKARIGVVEGRGAAANDELREFTARDEQGLLAFVSNLFDAGCDALIIHARKAVLGGLSPKDNREIPPLRYDVAAAMKRAFPNLPIVLNGGLRTAAQVLEQLQVFDGVMLGREAYHRPMLLAELDRLLCRGTPAPNTEFEFVIRRMAGYATERLRCGDSLPAITRHMLGLCAGRPGAREYRRRLSEGARRAGADESVLLALLSIPLRA